MVRASRVAASARAETSTQDPATVRRASGKRLVPVVEVCPNATPEMGFFHLLWWPTQRYCEECRPAALNERARKQKLKRATRRKNWTDEQLTEAAAPLAELARELNARIRALQAQADFDDRPVAELASILVTRSQAVSHAARALENAVIASPLAKYLRPADQA